MASYVFARICDERHFTYELALEDITGLITDERYYTRNESPPKIMRRTPMVGIGNDSGELVHRLRSAQGSTGRISATKLFLTGIASR